MEKTNGAASIMNLTAQAGLANLPNIGRQMQADGGSFSETFMKTSEVKSTDFSKEQPAKTTTAVSPESKSMPDNLRTSQDVNKQQKEQSLDGDKMKDLAKEVKDITDQIKEKIKDGFEVTDEEIEDAMEVLGLTIADLVNPTDLRSLIMELTGTDNSIELLTNVELYNGVKEITALADELINQVSEKFDISTEQLKEVMNSDSFKAALEAEAGKITDESENAEAQMITDVLETDPSTAAETTETATVKTVKTDDETEEITPQVKVEIEISEEARTSNPVVQSQQTDSGSDGNGKKNEFGKNDSNKNDQIAAVQTTTTTTQTVNTVGDIVETVTSYTSYSDTENVMRQVTDFVKVNITEDATEMEMRLHPASLGTVNMQINSQNGQITAHLTVQNELVKSILESQMVRLQNTFNEQGTKVTAIEISVANYNLDRGDSNNYSQSESGSRRNGRRGINLGEIESLDELTEDEQLQAEVMEMNGSSVDYTA